MAVQNFPFDSLSADNPDRAANSKIFADYLKSFFSDGIFPVLTQFPDMHQLAVRASNPAGMSVVVDTGMGLISGRQYAQDAERTLQIPAADTSLPRKDRIVLRMDLNTQYRNNELYVMTGTAASSPQPPALTRNNVVYELALATISVAANATSITAADITDERANTDVCGYVTNVLGQVDTSVINAQFQAFFEQTQENTADWEDAQQAAFTAWFDTIKGQLGEDAAGNLQNQIGVLSNLTTSEKSNLVDAINEVNAKEPDVLDTMEEIDANTDAGKVAGALAVKELNSDIKFPDGVGFYPDIQEGVRGYNTDPARGADTFSPFKGPIQKQYVSEALISTASHTIDLSSYADHEKWTIDNFSTELIGTAGVIGNGSENANFSMNYNPETGILTCNAGRLHHNAGGYFIAIGAYYRVVLFT